MVTISRAHYRESLTKQLGKDDITFSDESLFTFALVIGVPKGRVWQSAVSNKLRDVSGIF